MPAPERNPVSSIAHRRKHARRESGPGYHERRKRLLSCAAVVFKEKGFQAASINDIAIKESERRFHWPAPGPRPADVAGLGENPL